MKTKHHKWIKQDGFRVHKCEHCNLVRYWDDGWQKLQYKHEHRLYFSKIPDCKRKYYFSDKIID